MNASMSSATRKRGAGASGVGEWVGRRFVYGEGTVMLVGGGLTLALCVAFFVFASRSDADTWVPVLVAVNAIVIGVIVCRWLANADRGSKLFKLLVIAMLLKMACTVPRYYLNEVFYKGDTDAFNYNKAAVLLVSNVRTKGEWSIEGSEVARFPMETKIVAYIMGVLYMAFGTTYFGAYLIFALVSWIGTVCFYRAYRIAFPNAPPVFGARLLFLLPSLAFWPCSPGKEGLMVFLVGLVTVGVARLLTKTRSALGLLELTIGALFMLQIRPHMLIITAVALASTALCVPEGSEKARAREEVGRRGAAFRIVMVVALVPVLVSGLGRLDSLVGTTGGGTDNIAQSLDATVARTEIGGSAFKTQAVRTPLDLPAATITVLYRPFPFEAGNQAALIGSVEGMLLLSLTVWSARWIWRVGPAIYRNQFAAFCGTFVLGFVVAFSNVGNAGILSRQRVQMLPLLMLVACAAKDHERTHQPDVEVDHDLVVSPVQRPVPVPVHP